jgi:hypothetical protein
MCEKRATYVVAYFLLGISDSQTHTGLSSLVTLGSGMKVLVMVDSLVGGGDIGGRQAWGSDKGRAV